MQSSNRYLSSEVHRRQFVKWVSLSSLAMTLPYPVRAAFGAGEFSPNKDPRDILNVFDLERQARAVLGDDALAYLNGGADDLLTVEANHLAYRKIQIRARRLVDVREVSTEIQLFGKRLQSPIMLCPVGFQQVFHEQGELATARAASNKKHTMIVSSVSNYSFTEVSAASEADLWFQLYPSTDRSVTKILLDKAEKAGSEVVALTVDAPVLGNRELGGTSLDKLANSTEFRIGNFDGILGPGIDFLDPGMTWNMVDWLRSNTRMKIVLKGIVTHEDAKIAVDKGVDGIIVSNHGGRQLESNRATIDCLEEVVQAVDGKIPVLIDGGVRRGTDIFKALALGAAAVCIGRPYCWGLGAFGQAGVELALELLQTELIRDMQLAGCTSIDRIDRSYIVHGG